MDHQLSTSSYSLLNLFNTLQQSYDDSSISEYLLFDIRKEKNHTYDVSHIQTAIYFNSHQLLDINECVAVHLTLHSFFGNHRISVDGKRIIVYHESNTETKVKQINTESNMNFDEMNINDEQKMDSSIGCENDITDILMGVCPNNNRNSNQNKEESELILMLKLLKRLFTNSGKISDFAILNAPFIKFQEKYPFLCVPTFCAKTNFNSRLSSVLLYLILI